MFRIERGLSRLFRHGIITGVLGAIAIVWAAAVALVAVFGIGFMFFGALLPILSRILSRMIPALLSSRGFAAGLVIGLIWALKNRKRNTASAREEETDETETKEETEEAVIETKNYRFYA